MPPSHLNTKEEIRQWARDRRAEVDPDAASEVGVATARAIFPLLPREGKAILFYAAIKGEVPTEPLWRMALARGCFVALPRMSKEVRGEMSAYRVMGGPSQAALTPGALGIQEPIDDLALLVRPEELSVIFVPGVAFDRQGVRVGHGAGYFDRFLAKTVPGCLKIGVGFDWQLHESPLPCELHDIPMDKLIIDGELIEIVK